MLWVFIVLGQGGFCTSGLAPSCPMSGAPADMHPGTGWDGCRDVVLRRPRLLLYVVMYDISSAQQRRLVGSGVRDKRIAGPGSVYV